MRVTKIIREYVAKTVKAMPKFAEPTPEELEAKALNKKLNDFQSAMYDEIQHMVAEAVERFRKEQNIPNDVELKPTNYNTVSIGSYYAEYNVKSREAEQKRKSACANAIEEILVNLELGADRKELDEMLKKLAE